MKDNCKKLFHSILGKKFSEAKENLEDVLKEKCSDKEKKVKKKILKKEPEEKEEKSEKEETK